MDKHEEKPEDETISEDFIVLPEKIGSCSEPKESWGSELEQQEASKTETRIPRERKVIADKLIASILEQTLNEVDPDGETSIVIIEHFDDEKHTVVEALDEALEIAKEGTPLVITSFWEETYYAKDPRWHAIMAYPNVKFLRLPFSLSQLESFVQENGEKRPLDRLAIRLLDIDRNIKEMQILAHDLKYAERGEKGGMEAWEKRAREILGQKIELSNIINSIEQNEVKSILGQLDGEKFDDFCVDIEGTLIKDGEIDKKLLARMAEESKTHPITIWTGGDIERYEPILRRAGVRYKITSKHLFSGATVERAVDDLSQEALECKYNLKINHFEQI